MADQPDGEKPLPPIPAWLAEDTWKVEVAARGPLRFDANSESHAVAPQE